MKFNRLILIISIFVFGAFTLSSDKKTKEGKLKFEISYPDASADQQQWIAMMPKDQILYFKNGNTRMEGKMAMGNMVMIHNAGNDESYSLMDMMGKKIAIKMGKEDVNKFKDMMAMDTPKVKLTDETKIIAGFTCKKVIATVSFKGEEHNIEGWYTDEIDLPNTKENYSFMFPDVKGFLLESTAIEKDMVLKSTCTSFEKMDVPDSLFQVPADYKITTMDDMMKEMGR